MKLTFRKQITREENWVAESDQPIPGISGFMKSSIETTVFTAGAMIFDVEIDKKETTNIVRDLERFLQARGSRILTWEPYGGGRKITIECADLSLEVKGDIARRLAWIEQEYHYEKGKKKQHQRRSK